MSTGAAHGGFVDQSHFNRHFKRTVGVTPTQYAASVAPSKGRSSGVCRAGVLVGPDPSVVITRSDRRR
jgi:AraC-like DNA-binding protein